MRRTAAGLAIALTAAHAAASPAAALPRAACPPPGATVAARGAQAVVYEVARRYRACLVRTRVHRSLATTYVAGPGPFAVAGRHVAFDVQGECGDFCPRVTVVDLGSGRRVEGTPAFGVDEGPPLLRLVLDARGRAAYLRAGDEPELRSIERGGDERLDAGGGVDPASVRIAGSRVLWSRAGSVRSHVLDRPAACARRGSATLARSAEARLYRYGGVTWGCHAINGTRAPLGPAFEDTWEYFGGDHVHLAGRYATVDAGYGGRGGARADLRAFDLSTGALVHRWRCCDEAALASVTTVVLAPTGGVAWTSWRSSGGATPASAYEVRKSDADGEAIVLDSGPELERDSLRLEGHTISWRNGGETRTATLR